MSHDLIRSCLQLSTDHWPPDHYTLLGLEPGDVHPQQIEQCVQERMERLRRYQLADTEQVTEAMNRLAQALVCLTDPAAKQAYDVQLGLRPAKRRPRPVEADWSLPTDEATAYAPPSRLPAAAGGLVLAWILWLTFGVAGLGAIVVYFHEIQASYLKSTKS